MVPLASFGVKQIGNLIAPNRQGEIIQSVLQSQIDFRDQIARRAFGRLTPRDHQQLQMQAEPQVNAIAGNVASRGLGSSPAGAAIVGDAQAQAYSQARQEALQALPMYDQNLMRTFATLRTDNSFNEDIDTTAQLLYDLLNKKKQNNEPMPTMDSTMAWLAQFLALAKSGM